MNSKNVWNAKRLNKLWGLNTSYVPNANQSLIPTSVTMKIKWPPIFSLEHAIVVKRNLLASIVDDAIMHFVINVWRSKKINWKLMNLISTNKFQKKIHLKVRIPIQSHLKKIQVKVDLKKIKVKNNNFKRTICKSNNKSKLRNP